jgi:hypothetical protein
MISELTFSSSYGSLWRNLLPNSDAVVSKLNRSLDSIRRTPSVFSKPERRAFLNEIAFEQLRAEFIARGSGSRHQLSLALENSTAMARLSQERFMHGEDRVIAEPSTLELLEVDGIRRSLSRFLFMIGARSNKPIFYPKFRGCGIVDSCVGDMLLDETLIEVKAGDRNFRAIDIRQLLIYCALNSESRDFRINNICCVNPRRGCYFVIGLQTLCLQLSISSESELLSDIVFAMSSSGVSR